MESRGTYREVTANRPDIILKNKNEKTCILIDLATPADRNITQKDAEKKLKYKSLCIEMQQMWDMKCMVIPVVGNWSHRCSNKRFKEKFRSHTRKTFNRFSTQDSYIWNIIHNTDSSAV
jgi:hypothetical protein